MRTKKHNYLIILLVTVLASSVLAKTGLAKTGLTVLVTVHNVDSYSGKYKITVLLSNDKHKTIKPNLGNDANIQDEPDLTYTFKFKSSPKSFIVCIDGKDLSQCESGINKPAKKPELVEFSLP